jgi:hypothetical protein
MCTDERLARMAVALDGLDAGLQRRDTLAVRSYAAELLACLEGFDVAHPGLSTPELPGTATAAIWLMNESLSNLDAAASEEPPDWETIAATYSFAESGGRQLADSLTDGS